MQQCLYTELTLILPNVYFSLVVVKVTGSLEPSLDTRLVKTSKINKFQHVRIQRGGQGVRTPKENYKNIGFLSYTGPDPLNNHKATKPAFNFGPLSACQRNAIEMAFCWRADDGLLIMVFAWIVSPLKKLLSKLDPL